MCRLPLRRDLKTDKTFVSLGQFQFRRLTKYHGLPLQPQLIRRAHTVAACFLANNEQQRQVFRLYLVAEEKEVCCGDLRGNATFGIDSAASPDRRVISIEVDAVWD